MTLNRTASYISAGVIIALLFMGCMTDGGTLMHTLAVVTMMLSIASILLNALAIFVRCRWDHR